jgi:hypothetical protein
MVQVEVQQVLRSGLAMVKILWILCDKNISFYGRRDEQKMTTKNASGKNSQCFSPMGNNANGFVIHSKE